MRVRHRRRLGGGYVGDPAAKPVTVLGNEYLTASHVAKVTADHPLYPEKVAIPVMDAVDSMPAEFRACVHDFGYVDVYRAWRRGLTAPQIRAAAEANGGRFEL